MLAWLQACEQWDVKKMQHCSKGIRKFQKELGLKVKIFPNLHIWPIDDYTKQMSIQAESKWGMILAMKVARNVHGEKEWRNITRRYRYVWSDQTNLILRSEKEIFCEGRASTFWIGSLTLNRRFFL